MLPSVKFVRAAEIFATGVGLRQTEAVEWQYYFPFNRGHDTHVSFALTLTEDRVLVGSTEGSIAVIDLPSDEVALRATLPRGFSGSSVDFIRVSNDGRFIILKASHSSRHGANTSRLAILDAITLDVVQTFHRMRKINGVWTQSEEIIDETLEKELTRKGEIAILAVAGPVSEIKGGRLVVAQSGPIRYLGEQPFSTQYLLDMQTGAIEQLSGSACIRSGIIHASAGIFCDRFGSPETEREGQDASLAVARDLTTFFKVADAGFVAAIATLEDLTERFEKGIDALICGYTINIRYDIEKEIYSDKELFSRFVDNKWVDAVPALRRLLATYLSNIGSGEGDMPWQTAGEALRALMLLDVDADDIYRIYLKKGDLEHDHYPYDVLYLEYLGVRGWRHEADLSFSVFLTGWGVLDTTVGTEDLFKRAEAMVSPERFIEIVVNELEDKDSDEQCHIRALSQNLHRNNEYQQQVAEGLKPYCRQRL